MREILYNRILQLSAFFIFITLCNHDSFAQSIQQEVILLDKSSVSEERIFLSDITDLSNLDETLRSTVENVLIGASPLPGRSREITKVLVKTRLKRKKLDKKIFLTGAERVTIERVYNSISGGMLSEMLRQFVRDKFTEVVKNLEVEVINPPNEIIMPTDKTNLWFEIPLGKISRGRSVIHVVVNSGNNRTKKIPISVMVRTFQDVLVSSHQLYRNSSIGADDVRIEMRETTNLGRERQISTLDEITDKILIRGVSANRILRNDMFRVPPLVARGAQLNLVVKTKNLVVQTKGLARQEGGLNQFIEVQPLPSGKTIMAKIIDSMTVIVEL